MKPISRLGIGSLSLLQLILAGISFISLAYLSAHYFIVWDFSKDKDFTLSDLSQKILAREEISQRESSIQLIVSFRKNSPHYQRVRRTVDEFVRESSGKIEAQFIDPIREPDAATRFASLYGQTLNTDLIMIDARPAESSEANPHLTRYLPVEDLIIFRTDDNKQRRPVGDQI